MDGIPEELARYIGNALVEVGIVGPTSEFPPPVETHPVALGCYYYLCRQGYTNDQIRELLDFLDDDDPSSTENPST